jgi:hypothetical protein
MTFNISEFRANLKGDVQKSSFFDVRISPPAGLAGNIVMDVNNLRNLNYKAMATSLPGKLISTTEFKPYGPVRKIAYGTIHTDLPLTFIATSEMSERRFFEVWQSYIYGEGSTRDVSLPDTAGPEGGQEFLSDGNPSLEGDVKYYNDYTSTVTITMYASDGKPSARYNMIEAYPINVSPIDLAWESFNQYSTFTVDFAYRHFEDVTNT